VHTLADAYGLPAAERRLLGFRTIEFAAQSAANEVVEQKITPETRDAPRVTSTTTEGATILSKLPGSPLLSLLDRHGWVLTSSRMTRAN
jgi:hypothetical protein